MTEAQREKALSDYRSKLMEHREVDAKLKKMRADCKALTKQYDKSENDLKALQSVGQIVGEVLRYRFPTFKVQVEALANQIIQCSAVLCEHLSGFFLTFGKKQGQKNPQRFGKKLQNLKKSQETAKYCI